jgi:hypothetical protein
MISSKLTNLITLSNLIKLILIELFAVINQIISNIDFIKHISIMQNKKNNKLKNFKWNNFLLNVSKLLKNKLIEEMVKKILISIVIYISLVFKNLKKLIFLDCLKLYSTMIISLILSITRSLILIRINDTLIFYIF